MKRSICTLVALMLMVVAPSAFALGKGTSLISVGVGQNKANIPIFPPIAQSFDETNVGGQFWHLFSEDYAFAISGAFGFGSTKIEDSAAPATEDKFSISSYRFRVGGDRVGKVGDRFLLYFGPGLEYASAKGKTESTGSPSVESETATTFSINGRIGGIMMLSDVVGISGEISNSFGRATYEEGTSTVTWMPNSIGAFWGLTFSFGGGQ